MIAKKHIHNPNLPENVSFPQTLVTALVDRIDFTDFVPTVRMIQTLEKNTKVISFAFY